MSDAPRIENVLLLLSPLSPGFLSPGTAMEAVLKLKKSGASRADISADPRLIRNIERHGQTHNLATPQFEHAARGLSEFLLRPVIGKSDVQDLSDAIMKGVQYSPTLSDLSTIGTKFAPKTKSPQTQFGENLGLVLYLALHAKASDGKQYTHLVFPELTVGMRGSLSERFRDGLYSHTDKELGDYGPVINLRGARLQLQGLQKLSAAETEAGFRKIAGMQKVYEIKERIRGIEDYTPDRTLN